MLPVLAKTATRVCAAAGVEGVSFECADMLTRDLSGSDIVLLTSQCWDAPLVAALASKLLAELSLGALVIDYTAALGEASSAPTDERCAHRTAFALECTVRAPVSWDGAHCFWVWRVVSH